MRILALETSGYSGSVAATDGDRLIDQIVLEPRQRTAQHLAPAVRDLLTKIGWSPRDVQLVAVTQGPGSFTGMRVGVTMAKGFAYATGAELIGVDTLEVLAAQVETDGDKLNAAMNAERQQLFVTSFKKNGQGGWQVLSPTQIMTQEAWLSSLPDGTVVTGSGLESLNEPLPTRLQATDSTLWLPHAAAVAKIAWRDYQAGRRISMWELLPNYFRESAAEEKLMKTP